MIWGGFLTVNGVNRPGIVRLLSDGSLAPTFPVGTGPAIAGSPGHPVRVSAVSVDASGRIRVTGNFTHWDGVSANGFVRLNADGSVDQSRLPQANYFPLDDYTATIFNGTLPGSAEACFVFGPHAVVGDRWLRALSRLVDYPPPSLRSLGMLPGFGYSMTLDTLPGQYYSKCRNYAYMPAEAW